VASGDDELSAVNCPVEMHPGRRYTGRCPNDNASRGRSPHMLDIFITSRVRRKIIVIYAKYPDFKTHVRGLAKLIKEDAGNIQRELKRLEKVGFLISEKQGNTKIYHTNKQFAIFKELQSIVLKSQKTTLKKTAIKV
jgi:predicted transcriptional regulator with HTH domain